MLEKFIEKTTTSIGLLILRVAFAGMMLAGHGVPKAQKLFSGDFAFPGPFGLDSKYALILAVFAEVVCAGLLLIGLFSRMACIPLIATMAIAAFVVHGADPLFPGAGAAKEPAILYLVPFAVLLLTGPGKLSLDGLWWSRRKPVRA